MAKSELFKVERSDSGVYCVKAFNEKENRWEHHSYHHNSTQEEVLDYLEEVSTYE